MTYAVAVYDAKDRWLEVLDWSIELPTQEGWYWAFEDGDILLYYFDGKDLEVADTVIDIESAVENWRITHWLGPLPIPEPPKENDNGK